MLKFLSGVIGGLVMLGGVYMAQANFAGQWNNAAPPSVNGPWLGDNNFNLYRLWLAIAHNEGRDFWPAISVSQTAAQANCTQLNPGYSQVTVSAGAGYVCLPTAYGGREVKVVNGTTQTINVYTSSSVIRARDAGHHQRDDRHDGLYWSDEWPADDVHCASQWRLELSGELNAACSYRQGVYEYITPCWRAAARQSVCREEPAVCPD